MSYFYLNQAFPIKPPKCIKLSNVLYRNTTGKKYEIDYLAKTSQKRYEKDTLKHKKRCIMIVESNLNPHKDKLSV